MTVKELSGGWPPGGSASAGDVTAAVELEDEVIGLTMHRGQGVSARCRKASGHVYVIAVLLTDDFSDKLVRATSGKTGVTLRELRDIQL